MQQIFSASGFFTVPEHVRAIGIQLWGGGASGAGGTEAFPPLGQGGGGGGGAGGYCTRSNVVVSPGDVITFTVGIGGHSVTGNATGINGGVTSCSQFTLTANGGIHGNAVSAGSTGGAGGTATGGVTFNGLNGKSGSGAGGDGGNSPFGGLGGIGSSDDGEDGNTPGAGGAGGGGFSDHASGAGAGGRVTITYFAEQILGSRTRIYPEA